MTAETARASHEEFGLWITLVLVLYSRLKIIRLIWTFNRPVVDQILCHHHHHHKCLVPGLQRNGWVRQYKSQYNKKV